MAKYYAVVKRRSDDELQHFKYVKKEKLPNGKVKYYYSWNELKSDLGFDERQRLIEAKKNLSIRKDAYDEQYEYTQKNWDAMMKDPDQLAAVSYNNRRTMKNYDDAVTLVNKYTDQYAKTPLGKIEQAKAAIDSGRRTVKDMFSRVIGKSQAKKASLDKGVKSTSNAVNKVVGDFKKAKDNVSDTKLSKGVTRTTDAAKKAVNNYKTAKSASEKANTIIKTTTPAFNKTANKLNEGTTSTTDITKKAVNKFKATESTANKLKPGNTATAKAAKSAVNKFKEDTQKTANKVYSGTTTTAKVGKEAVDKLKNELLKDVGDRYEYQSMEDLIKRSSTTHGGGGRRDNDRGKRSHGGGGRRR